MRVAVDAAFFGRGRGGDETYLSAMIEGLARHRGPDDEFPLLLADAPAPASVSGEPAFPVVRIPARSGPRHFAASLPATVRRLAPLDLVLALTHTPLTGSTRTALVLGDLSFVHRPQDYPRATALRLRTLVPRHVRRAATVIVPSEYTRRDVVTVYGADPTKVHVVPCAVPSAAAQLAAVADLAGVASGLAARGVRGPYLLYVGNLHPRKNVPLLIRAFRAARRVSPQLREYQLVIAGSPWFGSAAELREADGDPAVVLTGRVTDAERTVLLRDAAGLAYPSLFEGFGLPPVEAMAHGVPVLTSTLTCLPEVTGDAALHVDPADFDAQVAGLITLLTDSAVRARLRAAGPARAELFGVDRTGTALLAALRAGVGSRPVLTGRTSVRGEAG